MCIVAQYVSINSKVMKSLWALNVGRFHELKREANVSQETQNA